MKQENCRQPARMKLCEHETQEKFVEPTRGTIDRVAKELGEDFDFLFDVAIEVEPEDVVIWVGSTTRASWLSRLRRRKPRRVDQDPSGPGAAQRALATTRRPAAYAGRLSRAERGRSVPFTSEWAITNSAAKGAKLLAASRKAALDYDSTVGRTARGSSRSTSFHHTSHINDRLHVGGRATRPPPSSKLPDQNTSIDRDRLEVYRLGVELRCAVPSDPSPTFFNLVYSHSVPISDFPFAGARVCHPW
jgi:hypothetical protein